MNLLNYPNRALEILQKQGIVVLIRRIATFLYIPYLISLFNVILSYCTDPISPDSDVWIFGTPHGFDQNSKYLFIYVANSTDEVRPIWLDNDKNVINMLRENGYEAYHYNSFTGCHYLFISNICFFTNSKSDIGLWGLAGGATTVNLWHGNQIKEFRGNVSLNKVIGRQADYHIVTSSKTALSLYSEMPWIQYSKQTFAEHHAIISGYPRNDVLTNEIPDQWLGLNSSIIDFIEQLSRNKTIIMYMPTWRPYDDHNPFFLQHHLRELNQLLKTEECHLFIKQHPSLESNQTHDHENIVDVPPQMDIYPVLKYVDILVTDYSSVYFDFMILNRPSILFMYDINEYESQVGFHYDPRQLPEYHAYEFEELIKQLTKLVNKELDHKKELNRKEICDQFHTKDNDLASKIIMNFLM